MADGLYRSEMKPHAVLQSVIAFQVRYTVPFLFCGDRAGAEYTTFWLLAKYAREIEERIIAEDGADYDVARVVADIQREMLEAAEALEFERAAALRDELRELQSSCKNPANPPQSPKTKRKERKGRQ